MLVAHIAGIPVEETLPALLPLTYISVAYGGAHIRRLGRQLGQHSRLKRQRGLE
jgi:hypothetical protein